MTYSESQKRASAKYNAKAYDRIELKVKKGKKDEIKEHAESMGESVNGFINRAIDETIARDNTDKPSAANESEERLVLPREE